MIVLKATQEKVLAILQSVAGIVERRHTLPLLANCLISGRNGTFQEADPVLTPALLHAWQQPRPVRGARVCKVTRRARGAPKQACKRRKRMETSCWRLVGDGSTKPRRRKMWS